MKVIDLLNKIANGEEAPKHIKYKGWLFSFDRQPCDYYCEEYGNLFEYLINEKRTIEFLNDEVEILEEKKIPDDLYSWFTMDYSDDLHEVIKKSNINFRNITEKLDEIIDYLKSKGE